MQKDFQAFIAEQNEQNAKRVMKHADKLSAQCVYFAEIEQAKKILGL